MVCGDDVARKKPDPEAYVRALDALGLAPGETLALEDSPARVAAARAAGIPVVMTRSVYFAGDAGAGALAAGPGLQAREAWYPPPPPNQGATTQRRPWRSIPQPPPCQARQGRD